MWVAIMCRKKIKKIAIVGFLIFISKQSQRVTQLLGTNPVAVLDTLFLLSYTKPLLLHFLSLILHYAQKDSVVYGSRVYRYKYLGLNFPTELSWSTMHA